MQQIFIFRMNQPNQRHKLISILALIMVPLVMFQQIHSQQVPRQWLKKLFSPKHEMCTCMETLTIDHIKFHSNPLFLKKKKQHNTTPIYEIVFI